MEWRVFDIYVSVLFDDFTNLKFLKMNKHMPIKLRGIKGSVYKIG